MKSRIAYADTDAGGVMYHGRAVELFERARFEFFEVRAVNLAQLADEGFRFVVSTLEIRFVSPGRLGERIRVETDVNKAGRASVTFQQRIHCEEDNRLLCSGAVRVGCINAAGKPTPIPSQLSKLLLNNPKHSMKGT